MRNILTNVAVGAVCLIVGLCAGLGLGPELKASAAGKWLSSAGSKLPWSKNKLDGEDGPFESYDYPTLKWRPKPLSDADGAIVRMWTTYEPGAAPDQNGTMKYKLTLFKATKKDQREVQLLDEMGFKIMQFSANDFHDMPGAPDIVEARDSVQMPEAQYQKARDFSVK